MSNTVASNNDVTNLRRARAALSATQRQAILDAAVKILRQEGLEALSLRRLARAVNASTTVVYTMFGGKPGLIDALYLEGFSRWAARLRAVRAKAPATRLKAMHAAYWRFAQEEPAYYQVMFAGAVAEFRAAPETAQAAWSTLVLYIEAVAECQRAGLLRAGDPEAIARLLWAVCHGVAGLHVAGHVRMSERLFWAALEAALEGLRP
jgi:AcrR family transcriptional regulator